MSNLWTTDDIDLLRKMWPMATQPELRAAFPQRNQEGLIRKASKLKIKRNYSGFGLIWSQDEHKLLRKLMLSDLHIDDVAEHFPGKSKSAARAMASKMGYLRSGTSIYKKTVWTDDKDALLRALWRVEPDMQEISRVLGIASSALIAHAAQLKLHPTRLIHAGGIGVQPVFPLSVADAAYIAGLFDGEGCVFSIEGGGMQRVQITNTNREVLEWVKSLICGGRISVVNKGHGKCKRSYAFGCDSRVMVARFLRTVLPFLRIKRVQSELALDCIENWAYCRSEYSQVRRQEIHTRIRELNRKGNPNYVKPSPD